MSWLNSLWSLLARSDIIWQVDDFIELKLLYCMPTLSPWSFCLLPLRAMLPSYLLKHTFYPSLYPDTEMGVVLLRLHCCLFMGTWLASLKYASGPAKIPQFLAQLSPKLQDLLIKQLLTPSFCGNHQSCHPSESDTNSYQVHTLSSPASELPAQAAVANPGHFGQDGTASGKIGGSFSLAPAASKTCQNSFSSSLPSFPSSLSCPIIFQRGFPGEHNVSCG